jgi:hypothetical protein
VTAFWEQPAVIGVVVAIPSLILGYFAHRRAVKIDRATEQSGIASNDIEAVGQVIDGLNKLVVNLQEDNKYLRQEIIDHRIKLAELSTSYATLKREVDQINGKRG